MSITRLHGNDRGILQGWDIFYQRITLFLRVRIGQDKEFIITHGSKERLQIGFEILADYYFLSGHNVLFYYNRCDKGIICYPLIKDIPALQDTPVITVQAGDTHKDIEQVAYIWSRLSNEGASRNSLLVNLGGGMITDMGGFAGATFKRGLRTVNIPTTLMASVDAAVGGKTGINFNGLKNEVGSFYPPECVFIDCEFLRTIDRDNLFRKA